MKKVYVSLFSLLLVTSLNAQKNAPKNGRLENQTGPVTPSKFTGEIPKTLKGNVSKNKAVIYTETFNGSAGAWTTSGVDGALWLFDLDGPNGQFSDPVAEIITSTTAANGFMIFDADLSNADLANVQNRFGELVSPVVDLSANPLISIKTELSYRVCCSNAFTPLLQVSTDGFATMATFDMGNGTAVNSASGTYTSNINISGFLDTAANLTNFQFRYNFGEGSQTSHYFLQIDDIELGTPPDNDLTLNEVTWGTTGAWGTVSYVMVPESQMTPLSFSGNVSNVGGLAQTAVFGVSEASVPFAGASAPTVIGLVSTADLPTTTTFTAPAGTGQIYSFDFGVTSATADANPGDNTFSDSMMVTEYTYALEDGSNPAGNHNNGMPYEIGNIFNIVNDVTLYAADYRISTLAQAGAPYSIALYELDLTKSSIDSLFVPVYLSDTMYVGTTGQWFATPLDVPQNLTAGKAYGLFIKSYGDAGLTNSFAYNQNSSIDPFFNSVFLDLTDTTYYTDNSPAFIRMNFSPPPVITSSDADNMICAPDSIILTSSAATGNNWSTGETTQSIVVKTSGFYYVQVNGLFSQDITITASTEDTVYTAVGTNPTACGGADGSIAVTFSGAANGTIIWTGVTSGNMPNATTPATISGLAASGYSVTYDNGTGCISDPMAVSLSDPGAIVPVISAGGATTFCDGLNVVLTSSITGGNMWSETSTTDAITVTTSGNYYAVNSTTPGCIGASNVISVTVNALPAVNAGADMAICAGDMATLMGAGAVSYVWDNAVTDGVAFTPAATATYTVTGTDGNGCVNTDATTITVNPLPVVTFGALAQICVYNAAITLNATPAGGTYSGTGVTGSTFNPAGIPVGTYTITYDVAVLGCSASATQTIAVDSCLSVIDMDQANLLIYPNPSNGKFIVSADNLNDYDVIELKDQLGRIVGTWKVNNVSMTIETKNITKGNYLLVVKGQNGQLVKQIQIMD